jgi:hypothetical protein
LTLFSSNTHDNNAFSIINNSIAMRKCIKTLHPGGNPRSSGLEADKMTTRDRCYDFLNIFAEKFSKKMAFFTQNKAKLRKSLIITLVFEKNANFLPKIGKNRRKL